MAPKILILGKVLWAQKEVDEILGPIAEIVVCESKTREEFKQDIVGKYAGVTSIYFQEASVPYTGKLDKEFISWLPESVKTISNNGAGYDKVDVHAALAKGIQVSHTPGAVDNATATTAVYLILSAIRQYYRAEKSLREGNWKNGLELAFDPEGKTLAIVGMGGIGSVIARRMSQGWGMKILYHNRNPIAAGKPGAEYEYCASLEEMLGRADVVSLNMPLNKNTEKSFGEQQFKWMKKGSCLVNTARGGVVDEPALIAALKSGHLYGAGLDVFPDEPNVNPEFYGMDNVCLLPHMGTETQDTRKIMEMQMIANIKAFIESGRVQNLVPEQQGKL